jgi:hypothetical protein
MPALARRDDAIMGENDVYSEIYVECRTKAPILADTPANVYFTFIPMALHGHQPQQKHGHLAMAGQSRDRHKVDAFTAYLWKTWSAVMAMRLDCHRRLVAT